LILALERDADQLDDACCKCHCHRSPNTG
jgi:hypothetical protein